MNQLARVMSGHWWTHGKECHWPEDVCSCRSRLRDGDLILVVEGPFTVRTRLSCSICVLMVVGLHGLVRLPLGNRFTPLEWRDMLEFVENV